MHGQQISLHMGVAQTRRAQPGQESDDPTPGFGQPDPLFRGREPGQQLFRRIGTLADGLFFYRQNTVGVGQRGCQSTDRPGSQCRFLRNGHVQAGSIAPGVRLVKGNVDNSLVVKYNEAARTPWTIGELEGKATWWPTAKR